MPTHDDGQDLLGAEIIELEGVEFMEEEHPLTRAEEIQGSVQRQLEDAIQHYEENLEPDQVKATRYYNAQPFGDEEKGRSQAISSDVRDAVRARMPSVMRIFFGSESVVEFRPRRAESDQMARQATDYIQYIIREDNPGYEIFYGAFKDADVRRMGIIKWWVEDHEQQTTAVHTGLTEEMVALLMEDGSDVQVLGAGPDGTLEARVTRTDRDSRVRVAGVPNEEFVWTPNARSLDTAPLVAHVREVPASELVEMGIDPEVIEEAKGKRRRTSSDHLDAERQYHRGDSSMDQEDERDESVRPVQFAEAYVLVGDELGVAHRRKMWCVGPDWEIVNWEDGFPGEPVDEVPFAIFSPDPEPHTLVGRSTFDDVWDLQRIKSQILRGTLNSLAISIDPSTEVVQGEVNMSDLLNPEMGKFVRVRRPGMMREVNHTFVGPDTLPMLEFFNEVKETRTGVSKAAAGLDPDALQSSTQAAVAATVSASHQQIELVARNYAESGMKRLFRGLLKVVVQHANRPRVIRLRGRYVEMDPRSWDADMDVEVNVALGSGLLEDRMQLLGLILDKQEQYLERGVPFVSFVEIRNTLGKLVQLAGEKDDTQFFRPWTAEEQAQWEEAQANQEPQPDPALLLVQVEAQKVQAATQEAQAKMQLEREKQNLEREKMLLQNDRERDRIARDFTVKQQELQVKGAAAQVGAMSAMVKADREQQDMDLRRQQMESQERWQIFDALREEAEVEEARRAEAEAAEAEALEAAMAEAGGGGGLTETVDPNIIPVPGGGL